MKNQFKDLAKTGGQLILVVSLFAAASARAQVDHEVIGAAYEESEANAQIYSLMTPEELEDLVGPVALYPDDLVSIILPASTYPVQIVQAARFLEQREGNPELQPPDDWDDAVVALLNYPEVIDMMNEDLDWTWALGEAFLNQQTDVLAAVSEFRDQAYAAGNLRSDEHQVVRRTERVIEIEPADPEVIYVPYYEPARVIVYQPYPVYFYHPYPRYSYYYPYPVDYGFSYGYFFGVSTAYRLHWLNHRLYTYHYGYRGHPYYGRGYHRHFYFRHHPNRHYRPRLARSHGGYFDDNHRGDIWKPRPRHGSRPHPRKNREPGHRPRFTGSDQPARDGRNQLRGSGTGHRDGSRTRGGHDSRRGGAGHQQSSARFAGSNSQRQGPERPHRIYSDKDPDLRHLVRDARQNARRIKEPRHARPGRTQRDNSGELRNQPGLTSYRPTTPGAGRQASHRPRQSSDVDTRAHRRNYDASKRARPNVAGPARHRSKSEPRDTMRKPSQQTTRLGLAKSHEPQRARPRPATAARNRAHVPRPAVRPAAQPAHRPATRTRPSQSRPARAAAPKQARHSEERPARKQTRSRRSSGARRSTPPRR